MTYPLLPLPLDLAEQIWLPDGWHSVASGTLSASINPLFIDSRTGDTIAPADVWLQWLDTAGQIFAAPMRSVGAVKLSATVGQFSIGAPTVVSSSTATGTLT